MPLSQPPLQRAAQGQQSMPLTPRSTAAAMASSSAEPNRRYQFSRQTVSTFVLPTQLTLCHLLYSNSQAFRQRPAATDRALQHKHVLANARPGSPSRAGAGAVNKLPPLSAQTMATPTVQARTLQSELPSELPAASPLVGRPPATTEESYSTMVRAAVDPPLPSETDIPGEAAVNLVHRLHSSRDPRSAGAFAKHVNLCSSSC